MNECLGKPWKMSNLDNFRCLKECERRLRRCDMTLETCFAQEFAGNEWRNVDIDHRQCNWNHYKKQQEMRYHFVNKLAINWIEKQVKRETHRQNERRYFRPRRKPFPANIKHKLITKTLLVAKWDWFFMQMK